MFTYAYQYMSKLLHFYLQTTASEATFVALLAARTEALRKCKANDPDLQDAEINGRLVGYCSEQVLTTLLLIVY